MMPALGTPEACADDAGMRQASLAGGSGARGAPDGEREGTARSQKHTSKISLKSDQVSLTRARGACYSVVAVRGLAVGEEL